MLEPNHRENADPFRPLQDEINGLKRELATANAALAKDRMRAVSYFFAWALGIAASCAVIAFVAWIISTNAWGETARRNAEAQAVVYLRATHPAVSGSVYCAYEYGNGSVCAGRMLCTARELDGGTLRACCDDDPPAYNDGCRHE